MKNMKITKEKASSARVALLMIRGKDIWECLRKLKVAFENIKVIDCEGKDIIDRRLCLDESVFEENKH